MIRASRTGRGRDAMALERRPRRSRRRPGLRGQRSGWHRRGVRHTEPRQRSQRPRASRPALSVDWAGLAKRVVAPGSMMAAMQDLDAFVNLSPTTLADVLERDRVMDIGIRPLWPGAPRSEERRVGKECRSRWSPEH